VGCGGGHPHAQMPSALSALCPLAGSGSGSALCRCRPTQTGDRPYVRARGLITRRPRSTTRRPTHRSYHHVVACVRLHRAAAVARVRTRQIHSAACFGRVYDNVGESCRVYSLMINEQTQLLFNCNTHDTCDHRPCLSTLNHPYSPPPPDCHATCIQPWVLHRGGRRHQCDSVAALYSAEFTRHDDGNRQHSHSPQSARQLPVVRPPPRRSHAATPAPTGWTRVKVRSQSPFQPAPLERYVGWPRESTSKCGRSLCRKVT
jgi:hypothetical protein